MINFKWATPILRHFVKNNLTSSKLPSSTFFSCSLGNKQSNISEFDDLFKQAAEYQQRGERISAEKIYKQIIEKDPECKKAYDFLWQSWGRNTFFTPLGSELDDFLNKYCSHFGKTPVTYPLEDKGENQVSP